MKKHPSERSIKAMNILLIATALAWFGVAPAAQAVVPPPDGAYPGFNTAEGQSALFSLNTSTGIANTAVGSFSLWSNVDANFNTAVGTGTLLFNTAGENTAVGAAALLFNTTGEHNTATGVRALSNNTEGYGNTAIGFQALFSSPTGSENTANGFGALGSNTTGAENTATGWGALAGNTEGGGNTATGYRALQFNIASINSTAVGNNALQIASGNLNTALGAGAGQNQTGGGGNVYIGALMSGVAGENDTTYIRNVYDSQTSARAVYINADNKIGTLSSSRRYKEEIGPMDKASESIFALKPVTFRYKKEIDRSQALSFGLVAEEVAEISPDLITRDQEGKPQTVRYEAVNAMLLNEFLKEHKKVEEQQTMIWQLKSKAAKQGDTISELTKSVGAVTAQLKEQALQIQKVSAQVQMSEPLAKVALSNP